MVSRSRDNLSSYIPSEVQVDSLLTTLIVVINSSFFYPNTRLLICFEFLVGYSYVLYIQCCLCCVHSTILPIGLSCCVFRSISRPFGLLFHSCNICDFHPIALNSNLINGHKLGNGHSPWGYKD